MRGFRIFPALVLIAAFFGPQLAVAGQTNNFYGEVVHVSSENVKVYDPKAKQTVSFVIAPSFDQIFSGNGKTTYQMKDLKHGQYVRVVYDQKVLGMRHADKIFILNNNNTMKSGQMPH